MIIDQQAIAVYKFPTTNISYTQRTFTLNIINKTYKYPNIEIINKKKENYELERFIRIGNNLFFNHIKIDEFKGIIEELNRYYKIILNERGTFIYEYDVSTLIDFIKSKIKDNNKMSLKLYNINELSLIIDCNIFNFEWIYFGKNYVKFKSESDKLFYNNEYIELPSMGEILDEDLIRNIHLTKYNNYLCLYEGNKKYLFETDGEIINSFQNYKIFKQKKIFNPFQVKILNKNTDFINKENKTAFYEVNSYKIDNLILIAAIDGIYLLINNLIVFKEVKNLLNINNNYEFTVYDNLTQEIINYSIIPLISFGTIHAEYNIINNNLFINKIKYEIPIEPLLENSIIQVSNNKKLRKKTYEKLKIENKNYLNSESLQSIFKYNNLIKRCFRVTGDNDLLYLLNKIPFDIKDNKNKKDLSLHFKFIDDSINEREDDIFEYLKYLKENESECEWILKNIKDYLRKYNCFYLCDFIEKDEEKELYIQRIKKYEKIYILKDCFRK